MKSFSEYINDKTEEISLEGRLFAESNEELSIIKIPEKIGDAFSIVYIVDYLYSIKFIEIHNTALDTDTRYVFSHFNIYVIFDLKDGFWRVHLSPHSFRKPYWRTIRNSVHTLIEAFAKE